MNALALARSVVLARFSLVPQVEDLIQAAAEAVLRAERAGVEQLHQAALWGAVAELNRRKRVARLEEIGAAAPEPAYEQLEFWRPWLLERATGRNRNAVLRAVVLGQTNLEIGRALACSEEQARRRVVRGLSEMRRALALEAA